MIKQIGTKAALASAILLTASTSHAALTELVVNGGFETGDFTGWDQLIAAGTTQSISGTNPSSGSFSANLTNNNPSANLLRQLNLGAGLLTAGQTVDISFDYRGTAVIGAVFFAELFTEIDTGGVSQTELLSGAPIFPNADPNTWSTFNFTTTIGPDVSGGITLQLNAACGADAGCLADYYIDNVSIIADIEVAAVPVPAAAWLFGSAMLGLFGAKKRAKY